MNTEHYRKTTKKESFRLWRGWFKELYSLLWETIRNHWKTKPNGTLPIMVNCSKCGSYCLKSQDGDCYWC